MANGAPPGFLSGMSWAQDYIQKARDNEYKNAVNAMQLRAKYMDLQVMEESQSARLKAAELADEQADAALERIPFESKTSLHNAKKEAQEALLSMDDPTLERISRVADFMQQGPDQYNVGRQLLTEQMGIDSSFLPEEYSPEMVDVLDYYKSAATSTVAQRQAKELQQVKAGYKSDYLQEEAEVKSRILAEQHGYNKELLNMRLAAEQQAATLRANAASGKVIKRTDFDQINTKDTRALAFQNISSLFGDTFGKIDPEDNDIPDEVRELSNFIIKEAQKRFDEQYRLYALTANPEFVPESIYTYIDQATEETVGLVGTDGKLYSPGSQKLMEQKQEWTVNFLSQPDVREEMGRRQLTSQQMMQVADKVWKDPVARGFKE